MTGRFSAVVGTSGVGRDSVMQALAAARPQLRLARRVITRPANANAEKFDAVGDTAFLARKAAVEFALSWSAHGMQYAIPKAVDADLMAGGDVLTNLSRGVFGAAQTRFENCEVIHFTASREVLAQRLQARGRESIDEITSRLGRVVCPMPADLAIYRIDNSGALEQTVMAMMAALYPVRG